MFICPDVDISPPCCDNLTHNLFVVVVVVGVMTMPRNEKHEVMT